MGKKRKCSWMFWRHKRKTFDDIDMSAEYRKPLQQQGSSENRKAPTWLMYGKAVLFTRRRLQIIPNKSLHFFYEPNKQVSSAFKVKNTSRSLVAFKIQTNLPKSCYMRPPPGILTPGETVVINIVKFIEPSEHKRARITQKFRVMSLKVKKGMQFSPDLFEEKTESVAVEGHLKVAFLDPHGKTPDVEKLKKRLAEAEAEAEAEASQQACSSFAEDNVQKTMAAGGVVDEKNDQQGKKQPSI